MIAIDASRAFVSERTGIEEYSYQVIKHLRKILADKEVILYVRLEASWSTDIRQEIARQYFSLPDSWRVVPIHHRRAWTQIGLSLALLHDKPDTLLILAHTVPLIHPRNTIVVIHGLEYELTPQAYGFFARWYMRWSIKFSVRVAHHIIAVSQNTKDDLARMYHIAQNKISVVYEGVNHHNQDFDETTIQIAHNVRDLRNIPYILFVGRLEERKNIVHLIQAFDKLKARQEVSSSLRLVLVGKPGYGYDAIIHVYSHAHYRDSIDILGFVAEQDKWHLIQYAHIFFFATLYEGFGLPILEAQQYGVPVVTSTISSLPEVAGDSAVMVDPYSVSDIMQGMYSLLETNSSLRHAIIAKGYKNIQRFSWEWCAKEIAQILTQKN